MSAVIGSLRAVLGIDTAQFSTGIKKAKADLGGLSGTFKSFAAGIAGALTVGAITAALQSTITHLDEVGKAAQKIGTSTEGFSKLEYSAKLADVGTEQLTSSLGKLTVKMGEIAGGKGGDAKLAFDALGLSAQDAQGKLKDTSAFFSEIAEKFSVLKDGAAKNALAMAIFGKSYADIIPMLNGGAGELKRNGDELERLGGVVTPQAAQAAQDFNDNISRLQVVAQGFLTEFLTPVIPALVSLSGEMLKASGNSKSFAASLGEDLAAALRSIKDNVAPALEALREIDSVLSRINKLGQHTGNLALKQGVDQATIPRLELGGGASVPNPYYKGWGELKEIIGQTQDKYDEFANSQKKAVLAQGPVKIDAPLIDFEAPQRAAAAAAAARSQQSKEQAEQHRRVLQQMQELKQAQAELASAGKSVFDQTRTPLEEYRIRLTELSRLLKLNAIDQDTFNRAKIQAVSSLQVANDNLRRNTDELKTQMSIFEGFGSQIESKAGSWFDSAIEGTFKFKTALADLGKSLAKLDVNNLLKSLLSGGTGGGVDLYGGASTGSSIFSGIGSLFGFARGGSIMPGGSGGIDSQLVAFRKSPNERVDISKPGQSGSYGGTLNIVLHPTDEFHASVDQKVNSGMRQAVNVSVAQSGMQAKKNFGALASDNNVRTG
jgi:hypothetical protein